MARFLRDKSIVKENGRGWQNRLSTCVNEATGCWYRCDATKNARSNVRTCGTCRALKPLGFADAHIGRLAADQTTSANFVYCLEAPSMKLAIFVLSFTRSSSRRYIMCPAS